jgi:hypothetical protein
MPRGGLPAYARASTHDEQAADVCGACPIIDCPELDDPATIDWCLHLRGREGYLGVSRQGWSCAMLAGKTAAISLMALIVTCSLARARLELGARYHGAESSATQSAESSPTRSVDFSHTGIHSARLSPLPSSTPIQRWKKRDPLLDEKATQICVDDLDLRLALLPPEPPQSSRLELGDLRPLTAPRLRC